MLTHALRALACFKLVVLNHLPEVYWFKGGIHGDAAVSVSINPREMPCSHTTGSAESKMQPECKPAGPSQLSTRPTEGKVMTMNPIWLACSLVRKLDQAPDKVWGVDEGEYPRRCGIGNVTTSYCDDGVTSTIAYPGLVLAMHSTEKLRAYCGQNHKRHRQSDVESTLEKIPLSAKAGIRRRGCLPWTHYFAARSSRQAVWYD